MALYLIGDVQGCDSALQKLLAEISFSPSRDTLYFLGDLVNRGPDSAGVLRRLMGYGASAQSVLGNHDLHLLALAHGVRPPHHLDTLQPVLAAPDCPAMLHWLQYQRMAQLECVDGHDLLMVHAGVLPSWSAAKTMLLAAEVEAVLQSPALGDFLREMYGNQPDCWHERLAGTERLRVIVNALTRMRFCTAQGQMEFEAKENAACAPPGYMPWFEVPQRQTQNITVAFGHWSTLGLLNRPHVLALDTGCVWGGCLSAMRVGGSQASELGAGPLQQTLFQVKCEPAQVPS